MIKNKICHCGKQSIPGLIPGVALCQYHYNVRTFGQAWANQCEVDRKKQPTPKPTPEI